ncbi:complex I 24 kDa subunit family protein [Miniphocaeibacter halophilus]|uniref:NAD(P)H-dependent oxidoreductase subunit E n=1 Tax=Miniphocaeibacter halophilus TaxID=2931922 RepID=A0AC61N036_9FIRM|nr:NAD(P)H-dependent oxidoreductase subunit E [Miniphocaeibacter halophilus]QQK08441.1 NAD(P)H-dependent oxidoreductase subunit E [Miniphocaeibacter halophilus]
MDYNYDIEQDMDKLRDYIDYLRIIKNEPGAVMPALQRAQQDYGFIPEAIVDIIALELGIHTSEIYGVATFYSQFRFEPKGEIDIAVCTGTACYVKGANDILTELTNLLGIKNGETSKDGKYSIEGIRCIGACGLAPVIKVNGDIYGNVSSKDIDKILKKYR